MAILIFWVKITILRFIDIFKISPVIVITPILICLLLIASNIKITIDISLENYNLIILLIYFYSIINTIKKIDFTRLYIFHSKKTYSFFNIKLLEILKKTIFSCFLLLFFFILNKINIINYDFYNVNIIFHQLNLILLLIIISFANYLINRSKTIYLTSIIQLILIYLVLYIDTRYSLCIYTINTFIIIYNILFIKRINDEKISILQFKYKNNALIKASIYDLLSTHFVQPVLVLISIFIYIIFNVGFDQYMQSDSINILIIIEISLISLCFYIVIESVPNINWQFYSIIKPEYKFHYKRIFIFLLGTFGIFIMLIYFTIITTNIKYILLYSIILFFNLIAAVSISLLRCNMLLKGIISIIILALIIYLGFNNILFLCLLIIPIIIILVKSINDHYGWYEL